MRRLSLAAALVVLAAGLADAKKAPRRTASEAPALEVTLTIAVELPQTAQRAMLDEAQRIWRREGVDLRWTDPGPSSRLRVLVVREQTGFTSEPHRYCLAEFDRARSLIVASLDAAHRVVRDGLTPAERSGPRVVAHRALGLALGRAIAHEIGHYLLGTDHTPAGLMRAVFGARTLVDPRASLDFELDDRSIARLRGRLLHDRQAPSESAE